jgi:hypothetical protein
MGDVGAKCLVRHTEQRRDGPPYRSRGSERGLTMGNRATDQRTCEWMAGPMTDAGRIPAAKWWLAISRNQLSKEFMRQDSGLRGPATCHLLPAFLSPLDRVRR